jgi:molybdopterin molybdotransferase
MGLMSVAEALARVVDGVVPVEAEHIPVEEAGGRVLAQDLLALRTQPPFDASAMDGYAVRAEDVLHTPVRLEIAGGAAAGRAASRPVGPMQAVRIFTGAPVPAGADAIVIQENVSGTEAGFIDVTQGAQRGAHIRTRGYDFREGECLLLAGERLTARHTMLAAAMNHARLPVRRKPVVSVIATGDELVPPGSEPGPAQIVSSIPAGLAAAITGWGGTPHVIGIARDDLASLSAAIAAGSHADVLVTTGGASVGDHDLVRQALLAAGMELGLWKIAMRPGKPLMYGRLGRQRVLGLPGNPVSAMVCARIFLKPLIQALLGLAHAYDRINLPLAEPLDANGEREHYMRGLANGGAVRALPDQDSSLMRLLAQANCLIIRPAGAPAVSPGCPVPVLPLEF